MRERSGFWGVFNEIAEWIMRFAVVNMYWFLLNLPISFIFFNLFLVPIKIGILYYIIALAIFIPLLFFPSTVAMFATVRDWILKRPQPSLTKSYFQYFKDNYKKSRTSGIIFTVLWLIWYGDFSYFQSNEHYWLQITFLIIGFLLLIYTIQFLSLIVHLELGIRSLLKNAFFITIGKPVASLLILVTTLIILYLSLTKLWFLIVFFTGSAIAYLSFLIFNRVYVRVKLTTDKQDNSRN